MEPADIDVQSAEIDSEQGLGRRVIKSDAPLVKRLRSQTVTAQNLRGSIAGKLDGDATGLNMGFVLKTVRVEDRSRRSGNRHAGCRTLHRSASENRDIGYVCCAAQRVKACYPRAAGTVFCE